MAGTSPGLHSGTVTVGVDGSPAIVLPLKLQVYQFTLPSISVSLLAIKKITIALLS